MYLGNGYTFSSLDSFITGFTIAAADEQLELNNYPNFRYFSTWLLGHLDSNFGLSGGWHWQIANRNPNNDDNAFIEFFSFLAIYKSSKTHSKYIIVDKGAAEHSKDHVKRSRVIDGKELISDKTPFKIIWTKIDNSTTVWIRYFDQNGNAISIDTWHINPDEALNTLSAEFGLFKNDWIINN
jgi:hypothetical protein